MNEKIKVIPVPTKSITDIILITGGAFSGGLVKKEYYGILNEEMGDTYIHLVGIGEGKILPGDTVVNLKTKEIYFAGEGDVYPSYERPIVFSTDSSLFYSKGTSYKIPTIHRSTFSNLIQQHNHLDGRSMWLEVEMEQPQFPNRTDDIHLDSVMFNQWLEIKDEWFIKINNGVVVVCEKPLETIHPNNIATDYLKEIKAKGTDARVLAGAFKAGMDYAGIRTKSYSNAAENFVKNTSYNIKEEQVERDPLYRGPYYKKFSDIYNL